MRSSLVKSLLPFCSLPSICMLCGDLGYNSLEPLMEVLGERFINCGIAEQNMISIAAGLAESGMTPWVYSISPFIYARAFEQVRNDICLQNLPVTLIGSGAGFGYGMAGPSHHAIEDCACMSCLQNMTVYIPSFKKDFEMLTPQIFAQKSPVYIRLGRDETPAGYSIDSQFSSYRCLLKGENGVLLALGAIAGMAFEVFHNIAINKRPSIWICSKLPILFADIPSILVQEVTVANKLVIIEDHVSVGGLGNQFICELIKQNITPHKFIHMAANGYFNGNYGNQDFYREENSIGKDALIKIFGGNEK